MRAALVTAVLLAGGAAAAVEVSDEQVGFRVEVPEGVALSPELSAALVADFREAKRYGGVTYQSGGSAFADVERGVGLYVFFALSDPVPDAAAAVQAELALKEKRAGDATAGRAEVVSWSSTQEDGVLTGVLEYLNPGDETRAIVKSALWADAERRVHEVDLECMLREPAAPGTREWCEKALASFAVKGGVAIPSGTNTGPGAGTPPRADDEAGAGTGGTRQWLFIGGAALVLIALIVGVFWRRKT